MAKRESAQSAYLWLAKASSGQKRALLAASLGWMLDSMDVMLYALVLPQIQREMHLSPSAAGALMSTTLLSAAAGGIILGRLADRHGRVWALSISMLLYSVFTALCGFTHTAGQLALCRIALGIGMGGEWAAGAALVAETWPEESRGKALALVQSFWAVGFALAAGIAGLLLPHFGWRSVFFIGAAPALLTLWLRRRVAEPTLWRKGNPDHAAGREIFRGHLRRRTFICAAMNAAALFAWWGLFTWVPRFLSMPVKAGGHGLSIVQTSWWTMVMEIGTFLGYLSFGYLADRWNPKFTYIGYLVVASALVPLFLFVRSAEALLFLGPLVGFFGTGYFSGFSVISSELFPTALRGTAMGFTYNIGRIASAAAPLLAGRISESSGLAAALALTSIGFLLAALIATALPRQASLLPP